MPVDESLCHRDIADIGCPDLTRPHNRQLAQQIGVDLVPRRRLRSVRAAVDGFDRHLLHQGGDVQPANLDALFRLQAAECFAICFGNPKMIRLLAQ